VAAVVGGDAGPAGKAEHGLLPELGRDRQLGSVGEPPLGILPAARVAVEERELVGGAQRSRVRPPGVDLVELPAHRFPLLDRGGTFARIFLRFRYGIPGHEPGDDGPELAGPASAALGEFERLLGAAGHRDERGHVLAHSCFEHPIGWVFQDQLLAAADRLPDRHRTFAEVLEMRLLACRRAAAKPSASAAASARSKLGEAFRQEPLTHTDQGVQPGQRLESALVAELAQHVLRLLDGSPHLIEVGLSEPSRV
jgi:hypothetical protein